MDSSGGNETDVGLIGHNIGEITVAIEVRLFNSLSKYAGDRGVALPLSLPAGSCIGDILRTIGIPPDKVFLALRNGRDVTPSLHTALNADAVVDEGDVIALSGPVPYSWGYGAPVV